MEKPFHHLKANALILRAVQTLKRELQAWNSNLSVLFGAFLQKAPMTHRKNSKTRSNSPVAYIGRKARQHPKANLC